jgi:CheY-like chemotaxis protein
MAHASAERAESALATMRAAAANGAPFEWGILDLQMPDTDGMQLARQIKADPALAATRLVLLTSLARRGDAKVAQRAGFTGYMTKPVRKSQLYDCLRLVMGHAAPSETCASEPARKAAPLITRHQVAEVRSQTTLLVVDDNPVNQKVAVKMLEKLGHRVDVAGNGKEALAALARHSYQLVFMDCQMPEMDGFETTAFIRTHETHGQRLPIIAMTANAMDSDRQQCLTAGMNDFVSKPVKSQELQRILTRWLDTSSTHDQAA